MEVPEAGQSRMSVPVIMGNVPTRNKNFTGRVEILAKLREGASSKITAVLPGQDPERPPTLAVQGMGGVGKTAIAIEYAHRFRSDYDLIWWIPSDQLPSVRSSLADLAGRLDLETPPAAGIDGAITAVLDALRRGEPYTRWLLVFDNADQPEVINDLIPRGPGDVLVTSRNHRWQAVIDTVPMDVFLRHESMDFLRKRVPRADLTDVEADQLAEKLGDLPLALEQAGAMLSETGIPADEYMRLLDVHVSGIMAEGKSPDYPLTMTAAWKVSVAALRDQSRALELLRCCAFFGPEPIPRYVFRLGSQPTGSAVSEVISNPITMATAIGELGRYALVTVDSGTVKVHRLIQALLRDDLSDEQQAYYRGEAHRILAAAAAADPDDKRTWPRFRELLPHVNAEFTELPKSHDPNVRELARRTMRYLYQSGDYQSALTLTERFIEQWTKDSGADSPDVLAAQRHLGNIHRYLGNYAESYRVTEEALAAARRVLGEDDPTTLSLRASFGADLRAQGRFREALALDRESQGLYVQNYTAADARTLRFQSGLALDLGLNSAYQESKDLYDQVFRGMSATERSTPADVLGALIGLSWTLRLLGQFREAYDVGQEAREYGQDPEGLGPEHIATVRSVTAWTVVARKIPLKRQEALELGRETLARAARQFGVDHPDTLAVEISICNLLRASTDEFHSEALDLAQSIADRCPHIYGPEHPYTYGCLSNLGLMKRATGDPGGACELDQRAIEGLTRTLGSGHHFTLSVAMNLASDYAQLGRPEDARRLGAETWPMLSALLGAEHVNTLGCGANLALDLIALGDDSGRALQQEMVAGFKRTQAADFPDTIVAERGGRLDPDFDPPAI